jgi:hypothetical protein
MWNHSAPSASRGPGLTDLLGGQVMMSFAGTAGSIEYIRTGEAARACGHDRNAFVPQLCSEQTRNQTMFHGNMNSGSSI